MDGRIAEFERDEWKAVAEAHGQALDRIAQTHMPLPVDADGEPIRPGDIVWVDGTRQEVAGVDENCVFYDVGEHDVRYAIEDACNTRHVEPKTVESLLEDYLRKAGEILRYDYEGDDTLPLVRAEYAERIRKVCDG